MLVSFVYFIAYLCGSVYFALRQKLCWGYFTSWGKIDTVCS